MEPATVVARTAAGLIDPDIASDVSAVTSEEVTMGSRLSDMTMAVVGAIHTYEFLYYLRSISIGQSLYSAPKSGLDRLLGCD